MKEREKERERERKRTSASEKERKKETERERERERERAGEKENERARKKERENERTSKKEGERSSEQAREKESEREQAPRESKKKEGKNQNQKKTLTLICVMYPFDVGTVTLFPAIEHMVVPGFLMPMSWPVLGSTIQTKSVAAAAPRMTELSSVVVFPLPKAAATVLFMYRSFPRTVETVSLRSVPKGLGEVTVALATATARALAARAETSGLAGSHPRISGMIVLLLTVRVSGCCCFC